jgi:hypothetical protein
VSEHIFAGPAYDPDRDNKRLSNQIERVWSVMIDGKWHRTQEVADRTNDPAPSVLAQFGHLRKRRFGGHTVERRHVSHGLYEYRLIPNGPLLDGRDRSLDGKTTRCPCCRGTGKVTEPPPAEPEPEPEPGTLW